MAVLGIVNGIGLGAGLMYLFDRDAGRRRRALIKDKFVHVSKEAGDALDTSLRDLKHRAAGQVAEAASVLRRDHPSSNVLEARVRAQLGRWVTHPHALIVKADDNGTVMLAGPILSREEKRLVNKIRRVRGVIAVENRLKLFKNAGDEPSLQGAGKPYLGRRQATPAARLLFALSGSSLVWNGMRRGGLFGLASGTFGALFLARALSGDNLRHLFGIDGSRRLFEYQKTIEIDAPIEKVFGFWEQFENFPRFMTHVSAVKDLGGGRSHWIFEGPAGTPVSWDAMVTRYERHQELAWKSVEGSLIGHAGFIRFEPTTRGGTRLDIHLAYSPPGGVLGHSVAKLFGMDPKHVMDADLIRLKSLLEIGKTRTHGETMIYAEESRPPIH